MSANKNDILRKELQNNRIGELRKKHGYTQDSLGKRLNAERVTINSWEVGRAAPPLWRAVELAELFGVSIDYLMGRKAGSVDLSSLDEDDIRMIYSLIRFCKEKKQVKR